MCENPDKSVSDLASFLGVDLPAGRAIEICDKCNFENMKQAQMNHGTRLSGRLMEAEKEGDGSRNKPCYNHIRKGGVGGWKEYLTEEQSRRVDDMLIRGYHKYRVDTMPIDWG